MKYGKGPMESDPSVLPSGKLVLILPTIRFLSFLAASYPAMILKRGTKLNRRG